MQANTTPILKINHKLFTEKSVDVWVKLDYTRHPEVQGNKWHKLKLNIEKAINDNKNAILTFGGAFSNHIAATAAMAKHTKIQSIGFIRGEELANNQANWSHTLKKASEDGMQLHFISRQSYREKNSPIFLRKLQSEFPNALVIPEGGSNSLAIDGFKYFMEETNQQLPQWTHLFTAVGTGGTLAGICKHALQGRINQSANKTINGVTALKDADYLKSNIQQWLASSNEKQNIEWNLLTDYHHGGYAKLSEQLKQFIHQFEEQYPFPLDPIYTSKMFYAFFSELEQNNIAQGSTVLLLHTGGLQGRKTLD